SWAVASGRNADALAARIKVEVVERTGQVIGSFTTDVKFSPAPKSADPDRTPVLAPLLAATADLPPDETLEARQQRLRDSLAKPKVYLDGARIRAGPNSPYAVEVQVNGETVRPRIEEGMAFVPIKRNDRYAVRLMNDSAREVAATLTIDGLSMFAFS